MISKAQIKLIHSLSERKGRKKAGLFLSEGFKLTGELLDAGYSPVMVYATEEWNDCHREGLMQSRLLTDITDTELKAASLLQHPQQVIALFSIPDYETPSVNNARQNLVLVLDGVQDPGNLGTIVRLCDWFGIEDIICSNDTVDIFNPKAIQATMGAIARVRVHYTNLRDYLQEAKKQGIPIYGTFLDGENIYNKNLTESGIIIMGNEGNGISPEIAELVNQRLLIPNYPTDRNTTESLNVGIATAITCAEFRRRLKSFIMIIIMMITSVFSFSQTLHPYINKAPGGYNFWIYSPKNEANEKKPLVVFLHGASLCGGNMSRARRYGTLDAMDRGRKIDAYVLTPHNPGGAWNPHKIMGLVKWVEKNCDIDTTRIYVLGMSLGGYGVIDFAATYPEHIAAAMAVCGGGSVKHLEKLNNLPLWILHGTADRAVPISASNRVVLAMKAKEPETPRLIFTRLKGYNHTQPAKIFYMKDCYDWLFEHHNNDKERPVNRTYKINTSTIAGAYLGLSHRGHLVAQGRKESSAPPLSAVKDTTRRR